MLLPLVALACARKGPSPELLAAARAPNGSPSEALALGQALQAAHLDETSIGPLRTAASAVRSRPTMMMAENSTCLPTLNRREAAGLPTDSCA